VRYVTGCRQVVAPHQPLRTGISQAHTARAVDVYGALRIEGQPTLGSQASVLKTIVTGPSLMSSTAM
jgi:hypothetical protein